MFQWLSSRFLVFHLTWLGVVLLVGLFPKEPLAWCAALPLLGLFLVGLRDVTQTAQAIRRNYPILAHLRFFLEHIRPEIRQYFLEDDTTAAPFSRIQRSIAYQRAKRQTDKRPFGTQRNVYAEGHEWLNHSLSPVEFEDHNFRVTVGSRRAHPYACSVFNISAMSFGALSANAIQALNKGAKLGGFAHDTGEGSVSKYHRLHGGDLIWNVGSGYFGCRTPDGQFNSEKFAEVAALPQVRMIELKLSQGAKPGHGGVLPAGKVTPEIAEARGVLLGKDCVSPASHSMFSTSVELLNFVESLSKLSGGKPVGIKLCIGHPWDFFGLVKAMLETGQHPDFIVVDGAEGGTGAAPLEFTDHVGMPLQDGLRLVHNTLIGVGLRDKIRIGASGKVITAFDIIRTMAMGADWCNAARGFMFALGCIQAQTCHTGACPTGVTTQDPYRQRALVVPDKAQRVHHYHRNTLEALAELLAAVGVEHPGLVQKRHLMRRLADGTVMSYDALMPTLKPGCLLSGSEVDWPEPFRSTWKLARSDRFGLA